MGFKGLRFRAAAVIAFLMGVPFVEQARASDFGDITDSVFSLVRSIIDAAGNS